MNIRRGVSRLFIVLWVVYGLRVAWVSYNAQGHITKEWIVWTLGRIIVPLLVVYFIVKIVEWTSGVTLKPASRGHLKTGQL